jgi:hypothetical protein
MKNRNQGSQIIDLEMNQERPEHKSNILYRLSHLYPSDGAELGSYSEMEIKILTEDTEIKAYKSPENTRKKRRHSCSKQIVNIRRV